MTQPKLPRSRRNKRQRTRTAMDQRQYETEAAYEITPAIPYRPSSADRKQLKDRSIGGLGVVAVIFSIVSLFFASIFMGPTSAVLGAMAYMQGSRMAGLTAILFGISAFVIRLLAIVI